MVFVLIVLMLFLLVFNVLTLIRFSQIKKQKIRIEKNALESISMEYYLIKKIPERDDFLDCIDLRIPFVFLTDYHNN
jgi:hypothetical protein